MEKFHHFLYASHFILEMNQKPLEAILSKIISQPTPRLQRILDKNFPIPFHCVIYTRIDQPTCRLLVPFRKSKGTLSSSPSCMLTRLPEVTACNKLELLHKKMTCLHYSCKPSCKDGQALLRKCPVIYSLIGHLERN